MKLNWIDREGDAYADGGNPVFPARFEIEQAREKSFWAFEQGSLLGSYDDMDKAKLRCQYEQDQIDEKTPASLKH